MPKEQYSTEQERFWASNFGNDYIERNRADHLLASNVALFSKIMGRTQGVRSILEFGANIGMNLKALRTLLPSARFSGLEINKAAYEELRTNKWIRAYRGSVRDFKAKGRFDLVFFKGVLIHLNPETLSAVYATAFNASQRYILFAEYYNPTPVVIPYRGHSNKLFKRDFAGELMTRFKTVRLIDYGFVYRRDPLFPQDDITWFLMSK